MEGSHNLILSRHRSFCHFGNLRQETSLLHTFENNNNSFAKLWKYTTGKRLNASYFRVFWEAIVTAEQHLTRLQVLHRSLYNFSLTSINSHTNSGFTSLRDYLGDSLQKLRETERCVIDKLALFWHVRAAVRKLRKVDNKKCCRNEWQTIGFI